MSIEENKALTQRFVSEVVNGRNLDLIGELVSKDFVDHEAWPGLPTTGPESVTAVFAMSFAAFSDFQFTVDELIAEGDKVVARLTVSGTHTGEFMCIPPTNKGIKVEAVDIWEIHDGKMKAHWGVFDQAAMMQQLGLAPEM